MAIEYRVRQVGTVHRGLLPPIVFSIGDDTSRNPFSFTDYLTVEQAFKIAADLTAQAIEQDVPF
jgi:hypothetical protein